MHWNVCKTWARSAQQTKRSSPSPSRKGSKLPGKKKEADCQDRTPRQIGCTEMNRRRKEMFRRQSPQKLSLLKHRELSLEADLVPKTSNVTAANYLRSYLGSWMSVRKK